MQACHPFVGLRGSRGSLPGVTQYLEFGRPNFIDGIHRAAERRPFVCPTLDHVRKD